MRMLLTLLLALAATQTIAQEGVQPEPSAAAAQYPLLASAETMALAVNRAIRPAFARFDRAATALAGTVETLCLEPSAAAAKASDLAFAETVAAFSRIELLKFGPLAEQNRSERLYFWADRQGNALRQVQQILLAHDPEAITAAGLAAKSVAVQGLGALEYVLFGTGAETLQTGEGAFRCQYGKAIAQAVATIAAELSVAWLAEDGIALHLMQPSPQLTDYRSTGEALEEIVGQMVHGLEAVRNSRLLALVGNAGAKPQPKLASFWRSGNTMTALRGNIDGLRALFELSRIGQAVGPQQMGLENTILFEFGNAARAIDLVNSPIAEAVLDPKQLAALKYLVIVTQSLQELIADQLGTALGLSVGFSALDGD